MHDEPLSRHRLSFISDRPSGSGRWLDLEQYLSFAQPVWGQREEHVYGRRW
jgi:hypothetical protein